MGKIYLQEKITPIPNKYVVADRNGFLKAGDIVSEVKPQLIITGININLSAVNSITLFCNSKTKILELTYVNDNTIICYPDEFGSWEVKAELVPSDSTDNTLLVEGEVDITEISTYYISLSSITVSDEGINEDSWETIKDVVDEGISGSFYSIGDVKEVSLSEGYFGQLHIPEGYKLYAFIIGIDHNAGIEGAGITFQFGYRLETSQHAIAFVDQDYDNNNDVAASYIFRMNEYSTRYNGWENSFARNYLLSLTDTKSLYARLPSDLKSEMSVKHLYTDNSTYSTSDDISPSWVSRTDDYLFLLSEYEMFGYRTNANIYEQDMQKQYAYYKSYSKKKYKHNSANINNPEICNYWTRSKSYEDSNYSYCLVSSNNETSKLKSCNYSEGFAPAFFIGNNMTVSTNIRIISQGSTSYTSRARLGSYIKINGVAYSEVGKILVTGVTNIEIWAKSASSNEANPFNANVGCKVNGEVVGEVSTNSFSFTKIYTYQTPANFSGVISISLVGKNSPAVYSTPTYYVKINVDTI